MSNPPPHLPAQEQKSSDPKFTLSSWQKILIIGVAGVLVLGYMSAHPVQEVGMGAYRVAWLALCSLALGMVYYVGHSRQDLNVRRTILLMLLIISQLALYHGLTSLREILPGDFSYGQMLLVLPYAFAPALTAVLLGRKLGIFVASCTSLFGMALMPLDCPARIIADYLIISMTTGYLSAILCHRVRKREHIVFSGFVSGAVVFVASIILGCFRDNGLASVREGFDLAWFASEAGAAFGSSFLVAVFVGGLVPILEKAFNISTHITWLEWADMNNPLLRRLQIEAPGTFHHCLYVQRLAEAAAEAVGADATRAGVCALYHDIGKLTNPGYFIENMPNQDNSPHHDLTPEASARVIIAHVQDGVDLANKYELNSRIIDVIKEHHGDSRAGCFYDVAKAKYQADKTKFDEGSIDTCPEPVNEELFKYKGPVPQTRESGIVSMADAVESAVRALNTPSKEEIRAKIDKLIELRILNGHLKDSQLTLGDIEKIKNSFFSTLCSMNHNRIAYPESKNDEGEAPQKPTDSSAKSDNTAVEGSAKEAS